MASKMGMQLSLTDIKLIFEKFSILPILKSWQDLALVAAPMDTALTNKQYAYIWKLKMTINAHNYQLCLLDRPKLHSSVFLFLLINSIISYT